MPRKLEDLQSDYETALAAHHDDPEDQKKRAAADRTATKLSEARAESRQGRQGVGVIAEDNQER